MTVLYDRVNMCKNPFKFWVINKINLLQISSIEKNALSSPSTRKYPKMKEEKCINYSGNISFAGFSRSLVFPGFYALSGYWLSDSLRLSGFLFFLVSNRFSISGLSDRLVSSGSCIYEFFSFAAFGAFMFRKLWSR